MQPKAAGSIVAGSGAGQEFILELIYRPASLAPCGNKMSHPSSLHLNPINKNCPVPRRCKYIGTLVGY